MDDNKKIEDELSEKKSEVLKTIDKILLMRWLIIPLVIVFLIVLKIIFPPFSNFYLISALILGDTLLIFPFIYFIKRLARLLSYKIIYIILAIEFCVENILLLASFFFWAPVIIYYIGGGVVFILALAFLVLNISSNPIFNNKNYSYFFIFFNFILLLVFNFLEYFNIHPVYYNYPVEELYHPYQAKSIIVSFTMVVVLSLVIYSRLEGFWNMFREQAKELRLLNAELEKKVKERTEELERSKKILEIKVEARTKELKELADNLEGQTKEKTKELQRRVDELERMHKLMVGRELKMMELKNQIKELDDKLKK